jgi:ABC-2 type transport system ATP-binding protein
MPLSGFRSNLPFFAGMISRISQQEAPMIKAETLTKSYGELRAVDQVSFNVREGEIYGLLGPTGAGKTTTLSMVSGLLQPDEGRVIYDGIDLAADPLRVKQDLGVVPQEVALYEELTARENLHFWGGLYGLSGARLKDAVNAVLEEVGLTGRADAKVETYSGGMKRRLNLSMGLVHRPRVVMMDEPTVGIDPQARANILGVVRDIARSGTTILYTTHHLEEAEEFCDRIAIMDHGKILAEGTLDELIRSLDEGDLITVRGSFDSGSVERGLRDLDSVQLISREDDRLVLSSSGDGAHAVSLLSRLLDGTLDIKGVSIQPPSLNGLFLKLTGRELRD